MVSAGCAAAMSHATAACVAGGNPDLHVRIPNLEGFAKDEVIIPTHSRNVYDAAIRAVGVEDRRGRHTRGAAARHRPADGDDLHLRRAAQRQRADVDRGDRGAGEAAQRAGAGRRGGGDPDHSQRPPAARRNAGGLQRRQVHPRSAERRPAAWPQGSGPGGLGPQRSAPRLRARHEDRARRDDRDARRGRALGGARSRRGVAAVDRPLRAHRRSRRKDSRRHRRGRA